MNGQFDIGAVTPTKYFFSIAVLLGLLFAMVSVDENKSGMVIFIQWQLQAIIPMALMIGAHLLLSKNFRFNHFNPWLRLSISGSIGASLFAPIALLIDLKLEPETPSDFGREFLDEWVSVMPPVTVCWLAINAPWLLGFRLDKSAATTGNRTSPPETVKQPEFMSLLPPEKRGRLILLKAELHYLQVVTEGGSSLILYNLSDAIAQLPQNWGMIVHRSYWVAMDSVAQFVKRGRQGELHLHDGQLVPVSRNRMLEVSARLSSQRLLATK